jgi:hypothetical protein
MTFACYLLEQLKLDAKFEIFIVMKIEVAVFWVLAPCSVEVGYQHLARVEAWRQQKATTSN